MRNKLPVSPCLAVLSALMPMLGCQSASAPVADAARNDLLGGEELAVRDSPGEQVADAGPTPGDLAAPMPDAPADSSGDRVTTKEDAATGTPEDALAAARAETSETSRDVDRSDLAAPADRSAADARPADATTAVDGDARPADGLAAEAKPADTADANPGDDAGCTGWNSLLRLSPAELADLLAQSDPIVINVHIPYEGDIPGTDTSLPYNNVDAIEAYLNYDRCADVVLICKSGSMSQSAGNELIRRGYLRVRDLAGGMVAWQAAGYPLLKDGGT